MLIAQHSSSGIQYKISLDDANQKDHGVFFPTALSDELLSELRPAPTSNINFSMKRARPRSGKPRIGRTSSKFHDKYFSSIFENADEHK